MEKTPTSGDRARAVGFRAREVRPSAAIGLTMGDPAGIGPEVLLKALAGERVRRLARFVLIGEECTLEAARRRFAPHLRFTAAVPRSADEVQLVVPPGQRPLRVRPGVVAASCGAAALRAIDSAVSGALAGDLDAIVTAPIHKRAMRMAGVELVGHTEILADRTGAAACCLMLVHRRLHVSHVTCHEPLSAAAAAITTERVLSVIRLTHAALLRLGIRDPRIGVAGLNPHAGEGGLLGCEDATAIAPAVRRARRSGVAVIGPHSPDALFLRLASGDVDAVVAQYHDQGHIPFKLLAFRHRRGRAGMARVRGVNVTLGLPFVRTSVDHGVAFDIAGRGVADPASMRDAIDLACRLLRGSGELGYNPRPKAVPTGQAQP